VDVAFGLVTHFTNVSTLLADNMRVLRKGDINLEGHTVGLCIKVVKNKLPCSLHAGGWPHHLHLGVLEVKDHIRGVEGTIKCKLMDWSKTEIQTCSLATGHTMVASFPGLHAQLLSLAVQKVGEGLDGFITMRAAADITFSLLMSGFVLSPSLFFPRIQFVLSVYFVLQVRLLLDRSWLATVRDISSGTHVINPSRSSPCFSYCKRQKLGVEAWE